MKFDLHTHTNYSDGTYSPNKLIDLAVKRGLNGISITDHDNVDGIQYAIEYSSKYDGFRLIPGIEFSTIYKGKEVHILAYFINYKSKKLLELTQEIKQSRIKRSNDMVKKINNLGMNLSINEVKSFSRDDFMGRPHIARALIKKGHVHTIGEAFEKYLGIGCPAYVERYKIEINEIIALINDIGGVTVLAHPGLIKDKTIVDYYITKGINGLECIYPEHSEDDFKYFFNKSKEKKLLVTGGSDFHGDKSKNILLGKYYVGIETIEQMEMMI